MRFSLFRELYIHHRSNCGPGAHRALCPAQPAPRESVGAGPPEGGSAAVAGWTLLGGQRLRQRYIQWAQDTASVRALSTTQTSPSHTHTRAAQNTASERVLGTTDVTHRHTHTLFTAAHTHIQTHTRLRTQLLHECLAPHRRHTQTHTLFTAVHTQTHTHTPIHSSGHSFCVSVWHHTDVTHRHTHSSQQRTFTFRLLGEPRQVGHGQTSPPALLPHSVPTQQLSLSPLRTRLLDDITVHTPGDAKPTGPGGRPLESSTEQDSCHRTRVTAVPGLRWDSVDGSGAALASVCAPCPIWTPSTWSQSLGCVPAHPGAGVCGRGEEGPGRHRGPHPASQGSQRGLLSQSLRFCKDGRQLGSYAAGLLCLLRESM